MVGNNSQETATLTADEAVNKLFNSDLDSGDAAPIDEPDGEEVDAMDAATDLDVEEVEDDELEAQDDNDDQYEDADDSDDSEEELLFNINGKEITLDEIGKGYLRQSDYTTKTQEIAAQKKEMAELQTSIAAEREHLRQMLEMSQQAPAEAIDWVQLATDDPLEYTRLKAVTEAEAAQQSVRKAEMERLGAIQQQENQQKFQRFVQGQAEKMLEHIPELKGENASQYKANISTYMEGVGYTKEELTQLFDHKAVVLADKARKYDELMSKKTAVAKKVKGKPRVLTPGVKQPKKMAANKQRDKMKSRLRNSGSPEDAVALLMG